MDKKWIQKTDMEKGALHKALGVPVDKKIPIKKLDNALNSKSMKIRKEANLAKNLKSFHSKKGK